MSTTLTHSGYRIETESRFKLGDLLTVTDCFGKKFPCLYAGEHGRQSLITINGGTMAVHPSQLSKTP